jgi:Bacterial flagellin N-terminal helical region
LPEIQHREEVSAEWISLESEISAVAREIQLANHTNAQLIENGRQFCEALYAAICPPQTYSPSLSVTSRPVELLFRHSIREINRKWEVCSRVSTLEESYCRPTNLLAGDQQQDVEHQHAGLQSVARGFRTRFFGANLGWPYWLGCDSEEHQVGSRSVYIPRQFVDCADELRRRLARMDKAQDEMSSGRRINILSDDPYAAGQASEIEAVSSENAEYIANNDQLSSKLGFLDNTLQRLVQTAENAQTLAAQALSGTTTAESRTALSEGITEHESKCCP